MSQALDRILQVAVHDTLEVLEILYLSFELFDLIFKPFTFPPDLIRVHLYKENKE